jgi:hypothetical protein
MGGGISVNDGAGWPNAVRFRPHATIIRDHRGSLDPESSKKRLTEISGQ